jgi:D-tyrosyl-tRNA(Tyr) deacylase
MRAIVQRVSQASVTVAGDVVGAIDQGLLVLLGIGEGDTEEEARWVGHKVANLRIFADAAAKNHADDKMNLSVQDIGGEVLAISQFTLYGDINRGFRPSFAHAASPDIAEPLVECFVTAVRAEGVPVETGIFGAMMEVALVNDGPVTIIIEREPRD